MFGHYFCIKYILGYSFLSRPRRKLWIFIEKNLEPIAKMLFGDRSDILTIHSYSVVRLLASI